MLVCIMAKELFFCITLYEQYFTLFTKFDSTLSMHFLVSNDTMYLIILCNYTNEIEN